MMKKHLLFFLAFFFIVCQSAFAQQRTITGVVTDENNEPLMGVAVLLQGNVSVGTVTELDGTYSISVPSSGAVLQFTSLGYLSQSVTVGQSNRINVTLAIDNMQLQETVVVGYGVHKKETLTGSIVTVKGDELTKSPSPNLGSSLMDLKQLVRRDQLYFAEKNGSGVSRLTCLSDFTGVRKDSDVQKAYFGWKFGSLPNINSSEQLMRR